MIKKNSGFTLIEVLLASALSAAVFIAVTSSVVQGVRLFERLKGVDTEQETAFFLERLTHDLKNSMHYSQIPFSISDSKESISFASFLNQGDEGDPVLEAKPFKVAYAYDRKSGNVVRTEENKLDNSVKKETSLTGTQGVKFAIFPEGADFPKRVVVYVHYGDEAHPKEIYKDIALEVGSW